MWSTGLVALQHVGFSQTRAQTHVPYIGRWTPLTVPAGKPCTFLKPNITHVSESESRSVVSDSLQPHGLYSPWNSPGQNIGVGSLSLLQGFLPNPGIKPRSPTLQAGSLPAEPPGKPRTFYY